MEIDLAGFVSVTSQNSVCCGSAIYARHGFGEADLRGYFDATMLRFG